LLFQHFVTNFARRKAIYLKLYAIIYKTAYNCI